MQQASGALAHDDVANVFERMLDFGQLFGVNLTGEMTDEEIFGLRKKVTVDRGWRLGAVDNANVEFRPLFGKTRIDINGVARVGRENHVSFFKVNLDVIVVKRVGDKFALLLAKHGFRKAAAEITNDLFIGAAQIQDDGFAVGQFVQDFGHKIARFG